MYTNWILHSLLNDVAAESVEKVLARSGGLLTGRELIRRVNADLALKYERHKSSPVEECFIPWEELSLDLLKASLYRGDGEHGPICGVNRDLFGGVQLTG